MRKRSQSTDTPIGASDGHGVDSLQRGLEILRCFQPGENALTVTEIARRLALPRTTTRRLLDTLAMQGFVFRVPDRDAFRLHVACFVLGQAVLAGSALVRKSTPVLQLLANQHDMHCLLCVRDREDMLVLVHQAGAGAANCALGAGTRLPIACTAPGHAWLWTQPAAVQGEWLARMRASTTPSDNARAAAIYQAFHDIAQGGTCTSFGGWRPGMGFVAAPVVMLDRSGVVIVGVQLSADLRERRRFEHECAAGLLQAASAIRG
ncbi:IclR family transcriptional regulator [Bordetella sp. BOR01]|uniref:IclR family transcriptional regulator n=1 Tax=Bordetella sp. BOR01 TaxID=2854779 RepID=UPI001C447A9C|nr:IclR family transcriptional regulator [Bordetella sp. BOR01]MBV7485345.1 IclR family transcriptional regulator [Bordetella sp. BOR01]